MIYFIQCLVKKNSEKFRKELLRDHLGYIIQHKNKIVFGGIVTKKDKSIKRVCYYIDVQSQKAALAFTQEDPYKAIYEEIEVLPFQQRIPETPEFSLESTYCKLS